MTPKKKKSGPLSWVVESGLLVSVVVLAMMVVLWPHRVNGYAILFAEEPMIVSQQPLSGVCTDYLGAERADLEEWTSSAGACDRVVCHVEPSSNYTITHSCRPREPSENPDTDNCAWVSNTTVAYPDCCPKLVCGSSSALTTIDPLSCYDLATAYACSVWYNLTSGCNDTSVDTYNISRTFCQNTCNLC